MTDPIESNPTHYRLLLENDRVRVLMYEDEPGDATTLHDHPDSVMVTLSAFQRRLVSGDRSTEVELPSHTARWVGAQEHRGENIGDTPTRVIFVELKENRADASPADPAVLGPDEDR